MHTYNILQDPGHNRVYYEQSQQLSIAELKITTQRLDSKCDNIKINTLADIHYISFESENSITENDLYILSRLSFVFAIFETVTIDKKIYLHPIHKKNFGNIDQKLSNILKYPGKTNEIFTRMMINVGLLSSNFDYSDNIQLLDPISGRGTTLYEAAIAGFNTYGIEIEQKSSHEAYLYFKKYLEREKYKHKASKRKLHINNHSENTTIYEFEYAKNKELFKVDKTRKLLNIINGNSIYADKYFKKNKFHLIIGDLPYGVAHGNASHQKQGSNTRSPEDFLKKSLSHWYNVLRKGGCIVLAWNTFVFPKERMEKLMENFDFKVLKNSPYNDFEHRVDNSIKRNIVVAKK